MIGKHPMKRRIIGKYSQDAFKLLDRVKDDGAIDDLFGNTDVLIDIASHKIAGLQN